MALSTLGHLKKNQIARIIGYHHKGTYRRQLLSLGLTPGVEIKMIRKAPLGDPMEFELLGFSLCLRRNEADCVKIEVCND